MVWACAEGCLEMLMMELLNRRRGRPKRRIVDTVREDMQVVGATGRCRGQGERRTVPTSIRSPLKF